MVNWFEFFFVLLLLCLDHMVLCQFNMCLAWPSENYSRIFLKANDHMVILFVLLLSGPHGAQPVAAFLSARRYWDFLSLEI